MLKKLSVEDFDEVYLVMEESFPFDERRTYEEQKSLLSNPLYDIYAALDEKTKKIKCFVSLWTFEKFIFIEHFATKKEYRGEGLGASVLSEIKNSFDKRICLEVEIPDNDFAKRRINFYKRNGFYLNDFEYFQPPISKGKKRIELKIMTSASPLTYNEFVFIKNALYKTVYGVN